MFQPRPVCLNLIRSNCLNLGQFVSTEVNLFQPRSTFFFLVAKKFGIFNLHSPLTLPHYLPSPTLPSLFPAPPASQSLFFSNLIAYLDLPSFGFISCCLTYCVFPENIHIPPTDGRSVLTPPPPWNFHSRGSVVDPPTPQDFPVFFSLFFYKP